MKAGRNDPCPCGSGKKYKKCCWSKDQEEAARAAPDLGPSPSAPAPFPPAVFPTPPQPPAPPPPKTPQQEKEDARWNQFESQDYEGRVALFLQTLEDPELMSNELAFEMLSQLQPEAVNRSERVRFAELVGVFRERWPEVFEKDAPYYLSWLLQDALAEGRQDAIRPLALDLAARAGRNLDTVKRSLEALAYHGQLSVLVETMRVGWPVVKSSPADILPWAISEFAEEGCDYEIFDYLERAASPDPTDPALLDRITFFIEDPKPDYLRDFIDDLTGNAPPAWTVADFTLQPPRKKTRDDWDDEEKDEAPPDQGAHNLYRLIAEFIGYLRREEGVPFPRGELVRGELASYFLRRHQGDLNPRPSMLESALHPNKKLPKAPKPAHPLCPERVSFDVFLAGFMGMFNNLYHTAAALFEVIPAWLRFLESRGLIDADRRRKTVEELRPLHAQLLRLWETYPQDPTLSRTAQAWPADAAKGLSIPQP
jgi:hypothetical protein